MFAFNRFFQKTHQSQASYRCLNCHALTPFQYTESQAICPKCHSSFPLLHEHIPVFLDEALGKANDYGAMFRERAIHYADDYRLDYTHSRWVLERLKILEPKVESYANKTWLEIGAGSGLLTHHITTHSFLPYEKLYVSDLSAEMLAVNWQAYQATARQQPANFAVFNVLKMPFPDAYIDFVIGFDVLHHILNYPLALQELARVTTPNGLCVFKEPLREAYHFYCFIIRLLLRFADLTEQERDSLAGWEAHFANLVYFEEKNAHQSVAHCDDKYFFARESLKQHVLAAGFTGFSECNVLYEGPTPAAELPLPMTDVREFYAAMLVDFFRSLGLSEKNLALVQELALDLDATAGEQLLRDYPVNTLFLFWK